MGEVITFLISYLLGSISFSYLIGKKMAGIDIRNHGSKNAGATNTLRVLGKGPALLVLLLDLFKGSVAVLIARFIFDNHTVLMLAGLLAIIGHNWPIFFGFKGGKGVATSIGVFLTLTPIPFIITLTIGLLILSLTRYVSLSALSGATIFPLVMYMLDTPDPYLIGGIGIMILTYIRHRANIVRLLKGEESKVGSRKSEDRRK